MGRLFLFAAALIMGAVCVFFSVKLQRQRTLHIGELDRFLKKCQKYEAEILDVKKLSSDKDIKPIYTIILRFRDEEQRKTIIHRYTDSKHKKYSVGGRLSVFYCEETDSACIENDNTLKRRADLCRAFSVLLIILSIIIIFSAAALCFFVNK